MVDEGVNTGPIIKTTRYDFTGNESLEIVENNLDDLSIKLIADVVNEITPNQPLAAVKQNVEDGNQYYKMPLACERAVKKNF